MNYRKNFSIKSKPVQFQEEKPSESQTAGDTAYDANCTQIFLTFALVLLLCIYLT